MSHDNSTLHSLTETVLKLEKASQAMYDNPLAGTDEAYLKAADELQGVVARASQTLQSWKTTQLNQLTSDLTPGIEDLEDKVDKLEQAVKFVENGAAGIQAAAEIVIAVRKIFGLP